MRRLPLYLGLLVLLLSVPIGVFLTTRTQTSFPTKASFQGASLTLSPSSGTLSTEGQQIILLLITGETKIDGADIVLSYNASDLSLGSKFSPGTLLTNPRTKIVTNQVTTDSKTNTSSIKFSFIFLDPQPVNAAIGSVTAKPTSPNGQPILLTFVTDKSQPSHSAVFEHASAKDILTTVQNGVYLEKSTR